MTRSCYTNAMHTAGNRVRAARERLHLRQVDLAEMVDTQATTISRIEGDRQKGHRLMALLADALQVDAAWLMHGYDDMAPAWWSARAREVVSPYEAGGSDQHVARLLAEVLQKLGEQTNEMRHLQDELRDAKGRLARLEGGIGGGRGDSRRQA